MSNTDGSTVVSTLTTLGASRWLEAGEVLHVEGAVVETLAVIVTGSLAISFGPSARDSVERLHVGAVVSLGAFITRAPLEVFVVAEVQTELREVDRSTCDALMREQKGFAQRVLETVSGRVTLLERGAWDEERVKQRHFAEGLFDPVTSANSKRWLTQALPRLVARHEQEHEPLCAAVLNLDHMKRFNDEHGFEAGHQAVRMVATTTWKWLRVNDRLVRVGGKEFVVLLPTTTLEEGAVAAERVRAAIASTSITTGTETLAMTVSVGVARHVIGAAHGDFIEAARTAMLDAKQRGRNQVVLSSSTEH